jgi:superoxide dismutase, Fe-Mn family
MMKHYSLPELPYDYAALEPHYMARLLELHHDKHHAAYVAGANATLDKLAEAREKGDFAAINQLQKNLAFHLSGHILHSLFWRNMNPHGGGEPAGELADAIKESFGSFAGMKDQLTEAALNVQGSGWGALAWEPLSKGLVVEQVYDHQGNIGNGTVPLLVVDMWEHAYYLQYLNVKGDWVKAFWKVVNWEDVAGRLRAVRPLDLAL